MDSELWRVCAFVWIGHWRAPASAEDVPERRMGAPAMELDRLYSPPSPVSTWQWDDVCKNWIRSSLTEGGTQYSRDWSKDARELFDSLPLSVISMLLSSGQCLLVPERQNVQLGICSVGSLSWPLLENRGPFQSPTTIDQVGIRCSSADKAWLLQRAQLFHGLHFIWNLTLKWNPSLPRPYSFWFGFFLEMVFLNNEDFIKHINVK